MQLKIDFYRNGGITLPIHYNHALQGLIYSHITPELADFLHNRGYQFENRVFRMFTFSRLEGLYQMDRQNRKIRFLDRFSLIVTSPIEEFCNQLGSAFLSDRDITLNNQSVNVEQIEVFPIHNIGEVVKLKTLSPVVVYSTFMEPGGRKYTSYYQPGDDEFEKLIDANLRKKYMSLYQEAAPQEPVKIREFKNVRESSLLYKNFIIKGYSFEFTLQGPVPLLKLALDAGIGSKNAQGFGCVAIK